ncbi:hypothetical protein BIY37_04770 [Candidatus Brocadia sapporoensis]|uniref:Uncharacterized protein n=1 Tax=Candidatus Brocadia sapporoensis TaxID=392547 RepID=A0A1V6M198_9BACT|nr:hypothetical protein [Candidatus Brocadia sapporoensis]MDG6005547.1 hypothetical protein [Candidatus Brocadia sp.]OQD46137.1 hypothetical protein BIY37_04770 [Candidatus Brocadia sapporoensis]GJQ23578.1 MAG: hypothetical protein HBSAPP01_13680 [Candidatus Brocadia sapporoensis]
MKKIGYLAGILAILLIPAGGAHAQSYKLMTTDAGQKLFFGSTTLGVGSKTVNVLPTGTVTSAVAAVSQGLQSGTDTVRLVVTKSKGNITIQAYSAVGTNTSSTAIVDYMGVGTP